MLLNLRSSLRLPPALSPKPFHSFPPSAMQVYCVRLRRRPARAVQAHIECFVHSSGPNLRVSAGLQQVLQDVGAACGGPRRRHVSQTPRVQLRASVQVLHPAPPPSRDLINAQRWPWLHARRGCAVAQRAQKQQHVQGCRQVRLLCCGFLLRPYCCLAQALLFKSIALCAADCAVTCEQGCVPRVASP